MRAIDWEQRLFALIESARRKPFAWGTHDCCTFAADAVEAVTGQRPALPGSWSTPTGALRVASREGGLPDAVSAVLGHEPGNAWLAQRGDVLLLSQPSFDGYALAVCAGGVAYAPGPEGLVAIRLDAPEVLGAWRVGH